MTTEKKIDANKQNAQLSTGPLTDERKAVVSQNAVKHGIFTKDLIISSGDGKEDEQEYRELLEGLIISLKPQGQMEHVLVEKIAVDIWRLKRVLRCESGSIRNYLPTLIQNYYNQTDGQNRKENKTNAQLDEEIAKLQGIIDWNNRYIKALEKGVVSFDKPTWEGEGLRSDIEDNLCTVCKALKEKILKKDKWDQLEKGWFEFGELKKILKNAGYTDKDIARELIKFFTEQNRDCQKRFHEREQEKLGNAYIEQLVVQISSLPPDDSFEKIIKYEKAIQKSIYQNLAILKRLQSLP